MAKSNLVTTSTLPGTVTRRSVPLTQEQLDRLRELASAGRRTLSAQMSLMLTESLEKHDSPKGRKRATR